MMDDSFVFKYGKYKGKTYKFVLLNNPSYIEWVKLNAPNLLKEKKQPEAQKEPFVRKEPPADEDAPPSGRLPENIDFLNQGPHGKLT